MQDKPPGRAPDYTTAALTMLGVNLMWILCAIWAFFGFGVALILAALLNAGIARLGRRAS
ncbi:hypothetical protein TRL7639_02932 [Falsiruegeria litorea R37]|uniref:Histidinol phosphate aminotransferase n=1 Tax=Falsiruegeria litorea R37 TaxID=1200284 RepID=A0A1Y5T3T6_9RHOB|nr:hypothetical protein [Falsiruegeria litorea]SLN55090.1 hypothetical protein TRL7639_02932 [Falsiruegeria litorea R37]